MALHSELPLYRSCYDLLGVAAEVIRNMRRDIKRALGDRLLNSCIGLDLHLRQANIDQDKEPELLRLLAELEVIELLARVCRDKHWIPIAHYAQIVELTQSIGKQTNGWRREMKTGSSQQRPLFGPQEG